MWMVPPLGWYPRSSRKAGRAGHGDKPVSSGLCFCSCLLWFLPCLSSCLDFPQWWAVTWKYKQKQTVFSSRCFWLRCFITALKTLAKTDGPWVSSQMVTISEGLCKSQRFAMRLRSKWQIIWYQRSEAKGTTVMGNPSVLSICVSYIWNYVSRDNDQVVSGGEHMGVAVTSAWGEEQPRRHHLLNTDPTS